MGLPSVKNDDRNQYGATAADDDDEEEEEEEDYPFFNALVPMCPIARNELEQKHILNTNSIINGSFTIS